MLQCIGDDENEEKRHRKSQFAQDDDSLAEQFGLTAGEDEVENRNGFVYMEVGHVVV